MEIRLDTYKSKKNEWTFYNARRAYFVPYINNYDAPWRGKTLQVNSSYFDSATRTDKNTIDPYKGSLYISLHCGYVVKLISGERALIEDPDVIKAVKNQDRFVVVILDEDFNKLDKRNIWVDDIVWDIKHMTYRDDADGKPFVLSTVLIPDELKIAGGYYNGYVAEVSNALALAFVGVIFTRDVNVVINPAILIFIYLLSGLWFYQFIPFIRSKLMRLKNRVEIRYDYVEKWMIAILFIISGIFAILFGKQL